MAEMVRYLKRGANDLRRILAVAPASRIWQWVRVGPTLIRSTEVCLYAATTTSGNNDTPLPMSSHHYHFKSYLLNYPDPTSPPQAP
jgi:hypothetical protein